MHDMRPLKQYMANSSIPNICALPHFTFTFCTHIICCYNFLLLTFISLLGQFSFLSVFSFTFIDSTSTAPPPCTTPSGLKNVTISCSAYLPAMKSWVFLFQILIPSLGWKAFVSLSPSPSFAIAPRETVLPFLLQIQAFVPERRCVCVWGGVQWGFVPLSPDLHCRWSLFCKCLVRSWRKALEMQISSIGSLHRLHTPSSAHTQSPPIL